MISFLTDSHRSPAPRGEAYVEALSRLESLRAAVNSAEASVEGLEVRDIPHAMPRASSAERLAFADKLSKAASEGLAAASAAAVAGQDVSRAGRLAEQLREGVTDLDRLLTL